MLLAGLVVFHAVLFLERIADASLAHPEVLAQWIGALLLVAGASALRRQGVPLLSGRKALVFWLLVLMLHVGFGNGVSTTGDVTGGAGGAGDVLLLLPLTAFATFSALNGKRVAGALRRLAPPDNPAASGRPVFHYGPCPAASSAGAGPERFSPRPPPLS